MEKKSVNISFADFLEYQETPIHIVPGTHVLSFLDNLSSEMKNKTSIWRTEFGGGYGALAASMLGSSVATLIVTAGPGITNILTVLAQAYNDRIPLVAIGINNWSSTLEKRVGTIHELGVTTSMFDIVTAEAIYINSASQLCENIYRLYSKAWQCRMPVYIDLPSDILDDVMLNKYSYTLREFLLPKAESSLVNNCMKMFSESKRLAILCGCVAIDKPIREKVFELSEILNAPIVTTVDASSFYSHKNHIGPLWDRIFIHDKYVNKVDAVLSIGCDLGLLETSNGKLKFLKHLGVTTMVGSNYLYRDNIYECDVEHFLDALIHSCKEKKLIPFSDSLILEMRNERLEQMKYYHSNYENHKVFTDIQAAYPEKTVFCSDVFLEGYAFAHFWDITRKQRLLSSQNYVNLGFSIPATAGASLLEEDAVCMIGDGGFGYYFTEISTLLKYKKKVKLILFNNDCFGTIRCFSKSNTDFYNLINPDYEAIARAYGLYFGKSDGEDISTQIKLAEKSGLGYIIEVNMPTGTPMFNQKKWY